MHNSKIKKVIFESFSSTHIHTLEGGGRKKERGRGERERERERENYNTNRITRKVKLYTDKH